MKQILARAALFAALSVPGILAPADVGAQGAGDARTVAIPGTELVLRQVFVPGGTGLMGSPASEAGRDADEGPVHQVRISGFWIMVTEVTQEQYAPFRFRSFDGPDGPAGQGSFDADAVTRPSPPYEDPAQGMGGETAPATGMTRWNALHYARWLSEKTGRLFRLPTEAEWEYACRGGGQEAWGAGADGAPLTPEVLPDYAWISSTSGESIHPVGEKAPNAFGVHDMLGNVAEWVMDGYREDAYQGRPRPGEEAIQDPVVGSPTAGRGVVRGGAFDDGPGGVRCAARLPEARAWKRRDPQIPKSRWWNTDAPHVGFRLVSPAEELSPDQIRVYWNELLGG